MKTEVIKISLGDADFALKINRAAGIIKEGGLVVFPTETVYGLGADGTNPDAARKTFSAKGRPSDNPLIIHIANPADASMYAYTNDVYFKLAELFMPGPLTVILKSKDIIPSETRGGLDTVAVRCPENKIARALISASAVPISAPSANISGSPSPTEASHVIDDMLGRVDMIIDGGSCDFGLESTIVKINSDDSLTLLRPGKITYEQLSSLGFSVRMASAVVDRLKDGETAISPGMKYRHYAPRAEVVLLNGKRDKITEYIINDAPLSYAVVSYSEDVDFFSNALDKAHVYTLGKRNDETEQANHLFSILRDADKHDFVKIYAPLPEKTGVGLALYNRLIRAAAHKIINL